MYGLLCLEFVMSRVCHVGLLCLGFVMSEVCRVWGLSCIGLVCLGFVCLGLVMAPTERLCH